MLTRLEEPGVTLISDRVGDRRSGDGGSPADVERVVLCDGSSVVIRPLAAGDEAAIASWFASCFAGLGADKLYARLYVLLKRLDPRAEPALAGVERCDHVAITAFAADGVTVGIARYVRNEEAVSAEVTVAVSEAWQGQGLARMLLERLAARARSVGIERLTASCLASDYALLHLLSRFGATTDGPSHGRRVDIRIDLTKHELRPELEVSVAYDRVDRPAL